MTALILIIPIWCKDQTSTVRKCVVSTRRVTRFSTCILGKINSYDNNANNTNSDKALRNSNPHQVGPALNMECKAFIKAAAHSANLTYAPKKYLKQKDMDTDPHNRGGGLVAPAKSKNPMPWMVSSCQSFPPSDKISSLRCFCLWIAKCAGAPSSIPGLC